MTTTLEICNGYPGSPTSWETATAELRQWNGLIFAIVRWCKGQWGIYEHSTGLVLTSSTHEGVRTKKALVKMHHIKPESLTRNPKILEAISTAPLAPPRSRKRRTKSVKSFPYISLTFPHFMHLFKPICTDILNRAKNPQSLDFAAFTANMRHKFYEPQKPNARPATGLPCCVYII